MKNIITIVSLFLIASAAHAGTFNMVEINPKHGNCQSLFEDSAKNYYGAGNLKHFARMNGLLYFVGANESGNSELWVTDGTQAGTHVVKEINASTGADIGDLRVVGDKLMFLANETSTATLPTNDYDLYVSDGTATGTTKIFELNAQDNTLLAEQNAGVTNGKLIFCTNTDVMVSDGSASGSKSLAQITITTYFGSNGYCEMGGFVYFIVNNEIWKSDGTTAGTRVVKTQWSRSNPWTIEFVSSVKAFDGRLYVIGSRSGEGEDLYTFDGTENGTVSKLINLPQGSNSYPSSMMVCGNALWFVASDTIGTSIYKLSSSSTQAQKVVAAINSLSYANDKIYMQNAANNGYDVIDARTNARTSFAKSGLTLAGVGFSGTSNSVITIGSKTAFLAYDSATAQQQLCITDGTDAGTHIEMPTGVTQLHPFDYVPGCGILDVFDLTYYNDQLVIPANFNNAGRELWFYKESGMATGITEADLQSGVALYPNPSNDAVTIELKGENSYCESATVQIVDMTGSLVAEQTVTDHQSISTSGLATGTYIVSVKKGADIIARRRLTVAH